MKFFLFIFFSLFFVLGVSRAENGSQFSPSVHHSSERTLDLSALTKQEKEDILNFIPALRRTDFTRDDLESALRYLVSSGKYDSAEYEGSENNYILRVAKAKKIRNLIILGNKSIGEEELRRVFGIPEPSNFDTDLLIEGEKRIHAYYEEKGFLNSVINMDFIPQEQDEYNVHVKITENIQAKFHDFFIRTSNPVLESDIKSLLESEKERAFTPVALISISKEIKKYFINNRYYVAELSEPKVTFINDEGLVVVEYHIDRPEKYSLDFPLLDSGRFAECAKAIGLSEYTSTVPDVAQDLASKIRACYISQGYARVEVKVQERQGVEPFQRRLGIDVEEGVRISVEKIEFTGRFSKQEQYYIDKLREFSSPVLADGYFVREDLDKAIKKLVIDSENNGYFRTKVVSLKVSFNKKRDRVSVTINLDEGALTQIQQISFDGIVQVSEAEVAAQLSLRPLSPLRLNLLEEGIEQIKQYYQQQGFLDMRLLNERNEDKEPLVFYNEDSTLAHLRFKIEEGPRVFVGSIVVEGNSLTKDYVVLKELEFKVGEILTPNAIEESQARLQRLGLFSSVEIRTLEEKTMIGIRTVVVKVIDRDPGLIHWGLGFTNELGLTVRGFVGYSYRNYGGMARLFSARADVDENITILHFLKKRAAFTYLHPYLFDSRTRGRFNLTNATFISDYNAYNAEDILQATASLEQEVTSHLFLRWDLWNWARYQDFAVPGTSSNLEISSVLIGSTGPSIELDYRDDVFNPTKGTLTRLGLEYGAPGLLQSSPQVNFGRAVLSFSHHLSPYKKIVWANQIRGGYVKNLSDPSAGGYTPWVQKGFLLGGVTTIRGFTVSEGFPSSREFGKDTIYKLITDSSMYLFKSELRVPLKGNIGVLFFYDGGAINITGFDYGFSYRHSAGLGFTYATPVGLAGIEFGWKLNQMSYRGEGSYAIDISIGRF